MRRTYIMASLLTILTAACHKPIPEAAKPTFEKASLSINDIQHLDTLLRFEKAGSYTGDNGLPYKINDHYFITYMGAALVKEFGPDGKFLSEIQLIHDQAGMSNATNVVPWGDGIAVLDISDLNFSIFDHAHKFVEQRYFDFKTGAAGSILESAMINPIKLSPSRLLFPVEASGKSTLSAAYYHQAAPFALYDTSGAFHKGFGRYPDEYASGRIYLPFVGAHAAFTAGEIYISFEASPEIQVYDHQGYPMRSFGSAAPEANVGFFNEGKIPTTEEFIKVIDTSTYYFSLFVNPNDGSAYRFVLEKSPAHATRARIYERDKFVQVYDAQGRLTQTCRLPKEITGIADFGVNGAPMFIGFDAPKDCYFICSISWSKAA